MSPKPKKEDHHSLNKHDRERCLDERLKESQRRFHRNEADVSRRLSCVHKHDIQSNDKLSSLQLLPWRADFYWLLEGTLCPLYVSTGVGRMRCIKPCTTASGLLRFSTEQTRQTTENREITDLQKHPFLKLKRVFYAAISVTQGRSHIPATNADVFCLPYPLLKTSLADFPRSI